VSERSACYLAGKRVTENAVPGKWLVRLLKCFPARPHRAQTLKRTLCPYVERDVRVRTRWEDIFSH
jgi:hypothetical protein